MGEVDIITFQEVKLSPMTFKIQESSFSPFSEETHKQQIIDVLRMGVLPLQDPRTRRKILEYISPDLAGDFDVMTFEERLQAVENARMLKGEKVDINSDDKHDIHLERLNMIVKHPNFYKLGADIQQNFYYHKARHQQEGMRIMREAQQMAMAMQGGGQMGGASGVGGGTQPTPNIQSTLQPMTPGTPEVNPGGI
jgi:hypothetical protein